MLANPTLPLCAAYGDCHREADSDLAVANYSSNDVSILLGGAGGSFSGPTSFAAGGNPHSVAVGDFNGDSDPDPDLAVANTGSSDVSALLEGAGGSFTGPTKFASGSNNAASIAVGDFNRDSDLDLAVANQSSSPPAGASILLGATGGSFTGPASFAAGNSALSVAVGDFNGDTDPDLAVANLGSDDVSVLLSGVGYPVPATAPEVKGSLVQVFKQCGTGGNTINASHAPPLPPGSCTSPVATSPNARAGSGGSGSASYTVIPGDVQIKLDDSDIRTPAGADYNPTGTSDLKLVTRIRFTDTNNCSPTPCTGPYTQAGTGTEFDFGAVPVSCVPNGATATPPGSDCHLDTTANTFLAGSVVPGKQASIQLFRMRVNDSASKLFQQQGILAP